MKIYKYSLLHTRYQSITMPHGAKILTVQNQNNTICLWAKVNEKETMMLSRDFYIFGTGHLLPAIESKLKYVGTVQERGLVWHIYESVKKQ